MKGPGIAASVLGLLGVLLVASSAGAQSFTLDWFGLDGGGGTSGGGSFEVQGAIGQPDASAPMAGGNFSVTGGFWAADTGKESGAPVLVIVPVGPGQAILSWTPNLPGYVLQESASLLVPGWMNVSSGAANPTTVPVAGTTKFYRLFKP